MHVISGKSNNEKGDKDNEEHGGEKRKAAEDASVGQQKKQLTSGHVCRRTTPGYVCECKLEKYLARLSENNR